MDEPINGSLPDFFSDEYFMKEALKEARKALEKDEIPVGAVITCKNRIVARAHNLTEILGDVTAHAEMQAITAAAEYLGGKYLTDCTIYVTLEPCSMCASALGWAQIQRIVYGTSDPKKDSPGFLPGYCTRKPLFLREFWKKNPGRYWKSFSMPEENEFPSPLFCRTLTTILF